VRLSVSVSLTQVRHSQRSEFAPQEWD